MRRLAVAVALSLFAVSSEAGWIEHKYLDTYDTGIRLGTGRWRIGAEVSMVYYNFLGDESSTTWHASLWINNIHNGSSLVSTGTQTFSSSRWKTNIEAVADFYTCYQGKSYAAAGDDVEQVGGNHVCTDPRPAPDPPPCDEDCQSPLVLTFRGAYRMTALDKGVLFDIDADGIAESIAWTERQSDVAFLALDRNGNGSIDSGAEFFGDSTRLASGRVASNGFEALADLDSNHDDLIDSRDAAWPALLLWRDKNHDGRSAPTELEPISATAVRAIGTAYKPSGKKDAFGNEFRYKGEFLLDGVWQKYFDVYLVTGD
jgi:hypothetical protein